MNDKGAAPRGARPASPLFADLYEFTMAHAYRAMGMDQNAVFTLSVRKLPGRRTHLIAAGIEDAIAAIEAFRFRPEDIDHLHRIGHFPESFLSWLTTFRFSGDVHAVAEGTPVFAGEPIMEVIAPIAEAQLLETLLINQIGFATLMASKAARVVHAAAGRPVIDFGGRRAQGVEAALTGAKAFHLVGVSATSNVEAGRLYGIPVAGTMAHAFIQAAPNEYEAFRAFVDLYPDTTLLVDSYDAIAGVENVIQLAQELGDRFQVSAIRLDSGDLLDLSRRARGMLDVAGLRTVGIVASGGLDEHIIDHLVRARAPIDAYGVGTDMSVSGDAPALDLTYKLAEYAGLGRMKLSPGKLSLPGRKQVWRESTDGMAANAVARRDTIGRWGESLPGTQLLRLVMVNGRPFPARRPTHAEQRQHAAEAMKQLPAALHALEGPAPNYPVLLSAALTAHEGDIRAKLKAAHGLP